MEYKRAKVIILPTEKASSDNQLFIINNKLTLGTLVKGIKSEKNFVAQELYIISDDEIKLGDWFLTDDRNRNNGDPIWILCKCTKVQNGWIYSDELFGVGLNPDWSKKIIATTDTSLKIDTIGGKVNDGSILYIQNDFLKDSLPQPSEQFILKFIEEYNKGNVITDVLVEYENNRTNNPQYPYKSNREFDDNWQLKVDKKNTITIKKLKDSWNREEVGNLIHKFMMDCDKKGIISSVEFIDWIEQNL